jgi:hypothetical protein
MVEVVEPADPPDDPSAADGWAAKSKIGVFPARAAAIASATPKGRS